MSTMKAMMLRASHAITLIAFVAAACTSGCAQIVRGSNQVVAVGSVPIGAVVQSSDGTACQTPCGLVMHRKSYPAITISMPGYQPATVQLFSQFNIGWFLLDLILTGPFVLISFSGGLYDLQPQSVFITLQPMVGAEGVEPKIVQLTCKPGADDTVSCSIAEAP